MNTRFALGPVLIAALLSSGTCAQAEEESMLPTLAMTEEAQSAFRAMEPSNPGLDSALIAMRASRICRGVQFKPEEVNDALAIVTGALSPSFRDNPDVSHGRLEREQINSLADNEQAFASLRKANVNCFEVEMRIERIRADLLERGRPLAQRLARVVQQGPASSEITVQEPVINVIVQEAPRRKLLEMLLPWNW